eukprot:4219458-Alexandrium_andersonii.AAC.1
MGCAPPLVHQPLCQGGLRPRSAVVSPPRWAGPACAFLPPAVPAKPPMARGPVSYTHLTLPTICSV